MKKKIFIAGLLIALFAQPLTATVSAVLRNVPICDGVTKVGEADADITWRPLKEDICDAGTVATDYNYADAYVKASAVVGGVVKKTKDASNQIRAVLSTPLKYSSCDEFVTYHSLGNGKKVAKMTLTT